MIYTSQVKDTVLQFLQNAFSQPDFYDGGNDFQWAEDDAETKIMITDAYHENLEAVEKRPAIIINRGPLRWTNNTIDQRKHWDVRTGREDFMDLVTGNLTANCFSRNGLEAEKLAMLVFGSIQFFARSIRRDGEGKRPFEINSLQIGPESIVETDSVQDLSVVPVSIGIYIQDNWNLSFSAPLLKHFDISINGVTGAEFSVRTDP